VEEDAVRVTLVTAQVSVAGGAIVTTGTPLAWLTVVETLAEQPLEGSVTVTEYEPGEETVLVGVVTVPQL
jgi:hypothetical protein